MHRNGYWSSGARGYAVDCFLLAIGTFLFYSGAVLQEGTFFVQDMMVQNVPFRDFFSRTLKSGLLALWDPAINCGFPLYAEGQAGLFYPFNFITYWLLPTSAALNLNIALHFWWAGVGAYALLRLLACSRPAALTGGVAYAFSGYLVVRAMSPNYIDAAAWMPFLFVLHELALQRGRWGYLAGAAAVAGLQYLAGHPQAAVYAQGAALLYGLFMAWRRGYGYGWFLGIAVVPCGGMALAAVQLLPTAELVGLSGRSGGVGLEQFLNMSLPPERLLSLILPNLFGNSSTGTYWGRAEGFFIQLCLYAGIVPVVLAASAGWRRRDPYTVFFLALALGALVLSLGRYTPIFAALYQVPGLSFFRIPTRFLLWSSLGVAILAGLGLDEILRRGVGRVAMCWSLLAGALGLGLYWLQRDGLSGVGGEEASEYGRQLGLDLLLCLGGVVGCAVLLHLAKASNKAWAWGLPFLVYADLWLFGASFNALVPVETYRRTPAEAEAILSAPRGIPSAAPPRLLSLVNEKNAPYNWHGDWVRNQEAYRAYPATLRMYSAGLYGLHNALPGWSPLHLMRHWEFMRGYPAVAPLAGVEYMVSHAPLRSRAMEALFSGQERVYRLQNSLPRAYVAPRWEAVPEPGRRLQVLRSDQVLAGRMVVLEENVPAASAGGMLPAQITAYGPHRVEIKLPAAHRGGVLVLSDTYYPGWRAEIDGRPVPVLRANHVFRGVALEAGDRQVVFKFKSTYLAAGTGLSLFALVCLAGLTWRGCRQEAGRALRANGPPLKEWALLAVAVALVHAIVTRWPLWEAAWERSRPIFESAGGA